LLNGSFTLPGLQAGSRVILFFIHVLPCIEFNWVIDMSYYTLVRLQRCPYCGSTNLQLDYERGQLVCRNCGAVLDESIVDFSQPYTTRSSNMAWYAKRETITDQNASREKLTKLETRGRAIRLLGFTAKGMLYVSRTETSVLRDILSDDCIKLILDRLTPSERIVALEAARQLAQGMEPLPSMLEREFGVPRRRLRNILADVKSCLGLPRYVDLL